MYGEENGWIRWMDGWMPGREVEWMDEWSDRWWRDWMDRHGEHVGSMNKWMNLKMEEKMNR